MRINALAVIAAAVAAFTVAEVPAAAQRVVTCESVRGDRRIFCPMNTRRGVRVVEQLSRSPCIRNRTYFVGQRGVQVRRGCRAVFAARRGAYR